MNYLISSRKEGDTDKDIGKKFNQEITTFLNKIDSSIKDFRFNVSIANFYEAYRYFKNNLEKNVSNEVLKENIIKIMKLMIPFTPHLAYESLEMHNCKNENEWPIIKQSYLEEIVLAVQVNGKTRDVIKIKKDLPQDEISKKIIAKSKAKKYIVNKKILKIIFVKNKIINYII